MATGELKAYTLNIGVDHSAKRCSINIKLIVISQIVENLMIFYVISANSLVRTSSGIQ